MARKKNAQSDKAHAEMNGGSVSHQPADGQTAATTTGRGSRRAKTDALNNAVWMKTQPAGSRKRAASESITTEKSKKKNKSKANDDHVTPEAVNVQVSIPLPNAPKKPQATTKRANLNDSVPKLKPSGAVGTLADAKNLFDDDGEEDVGTSETDTSSDPEEDSDEDDDEDNKTVDPKVTSVGNPRTAADKRFTTEQPVWSAPPPGNSAKDRAQAVTHGSLFKNSDEEANVKKPDVSQLEATKSLIIRGQVIELSDNEAENELDDSPTMRLVPASSQAPVRVALAQRDKRQATEPVTTPSDANASDAPADEIDEVESIWPAYTKIIKKRGAGAKDPILLKEQNYEFKLIIHKALDLIEERVRFMNAFPSFVQRTSWNYIVLVEACTFACAMPQAMEVRQKYETFKERVRVDTEYIGEISKLLDPRISILRGDTKTAAIHNVRVAYGLQDGCAVRVRDILNGSRYIYPQAPNSTNFQYNKPFENRAIIGTLRDDLFTKSAINVRFAHRFRATEEEPDVNKLAPAMIALAATAVYASIKEWESGTRISSHFTANFYESIYLLHKNHLDNIQERNKPAYNAMVRRLFRLAADTQRVQADELTLTDVQNMDLDV